MYELVNKKHRIRNSQWMNSGKIYVFLKVMICGVWRSYKTYRTVRYVNINYTEVTELFG